MRSNKSTPEANQLFLQGSLAFAELEHNGIRIDVPYLERAIQRVSAKIENLQSDLRQDPFFDLWRKTYGTKTNLGSKRQLAHLLFDVKGIKYKWDRTHPTAKFKEGQYRTDESIFEEIGKKLPFAKNYIQLNKYKDAKGKYLEGLLKETVDGYLHAFYNLAGGGDKEDKGGARSYRSSSSCPNMQNQPIRDPIIGKIIRRCFIARDGRLFVELDYGAQEFKVAACVWEDPEMIAYASDPSKDIHRDMAAKIFKCSKQQVNKKLRYYAKNMFVFPVLYGSYYIQCCKNLWEAAASQEIEYKGTTIPVLDWLAKKGITELGDRDSTRKPMPGTFEHHIKKVEQEFFGLFHVLAKRREEWLQSYRERGGFPLVTGFWIEGEYSNNQLLNTPIQGPAFHCLLWSAIKLQKWLRKNQMKTLLVCEIHDSLIADVPLDEVQDFLNAAERIMVRGIQKAWEWLVVPLSVEVQIAPLGKSWFDKELWERNNKGLWTPKEKKAA